MSLFVFHSYRFIHALELLASIHRTTHHLVHQTVDQTIYSQKIVMNLLNVRIILKYDRLDGVV